jgi:AraC family transcriptional regulator
MRRRLARAQDLLVKTDLALAEVALTTGFADQSHFCRRFRELVGLPPRSYRMQYR